VQEQILRQQSAIESIAEIEKMDRNTKMVLSLQDGGTGTGAAPVIAQLAKEREILTGYCNTSVLI
jgi:cell division protein FtsZ